MKHPTVRIALLVCLVALVVVLLPAAAHADSRQALDPIGDLLDKINCFLAKAAQDAARLLGVILWDVLKLCGMVGLLGDDFSTLFQGVIGEALGAIASGSLHTVIRGSLMLSLGLLGLSLLAKPFWPDLKIVSFQRAVIWGIAIQAFLLNAPGIYTQLETFRIDLSNEIADTVSSGSIPGCDGDTVPTLLCIAGATDAEVSDPSLTALPDSLPPYGGSETIHDLYDRCVYNPAVYYSDPACNPDDPTGDPWEVLAFIEAALGAQVLDLVLGLLVLCYGVLMLALGLSAGMMFVLFPVAGIFAFYQPLEAFPAGVIKNYVTIFLKSIVLLTLAGIVIRLFSIAGGSLISMAAVALVALFLCFVMAKEALATLLGSVSFIGNSVGNIGAGLGLTGAGAGANLMQASPESRMAAMMIGGGPVAQALMGAPNPYLHSLGGGSGAPGVIGAAGHTARAALGAALGGAGFAIGAVGGALAGRGAAAATATTPTYSSTGSGMPAGGPAGGAAPTTPAGGSGATRPVAAAGSPGSSLRASIQSQPAQRPADALPAGPVLAPTDVLTGEPPAIPALQAAAAGDAERTALGAWSPASTAQIEDTAARLQPASSDLQDNAYELIQTSHAVAQEWQADGRSPILQDGTLDPQFMEETVQRVPDVAGAFVLAQEELPAGQRIGVGEAVALGAATQRVIPAPAAARGFARAVKTMGEGGSLDAGLQRELGAGGRNVFGTQAAQAEQVSAEMQRAGLGNDLGRQLVETVQGDLARDPGITAQQFREGGSGGRQARMQAWDQATGDAERTDRIVDGLIGLGPMQNVIVREVPRPPAPAAAPLAEPLAPAASPATFFPEPEPALPEIEPAETAFTATPAAAEAPEPGPAPAGAGEDEPLVRDLRSWRTETAQASGRKAFHVFSDATLTEIAARRPQTLDELAAVRGVGPKKLEQYGAAILALTTAQAAQSTEEKEA